MPPICYYVCDECGFAVNVGWGSHAYAVNSRGERVVCPHPGEEWTVREVTGMGYFAAKEAGLCGVMRACTCVACATCFDLDLDRDDRRCPYCSSSEVRTTGEMIDYPCPRCRAGYIREFRGGAANRGMEAWARSRHPGFQDPEPWIKETIDWCVFVAKHQDAAPDEVSPQLPPDWRRAVAETSFGDVAGLGQLILIWARFQVPPPIGGMGFNRAGRFLPEPAVRAIFTEIEGLGRIFTWSGKRFRYHPDLTAEQRDSASIYASIKWFPHTVS